MTPELEREVAFWGLRPLDESLPVVFENGARWTGMEAVCGCGRRLSGRRLRGRICRLFSARVVDAYALCFCGKLMRVHYRLMPDMTVVGRSPKTGEWSVWEGRPSWWRRLMEWLFGER